MGGSLNKARRRSQSITSSGTVKHAHTSTIVNTSFLFFPPQLGVCGDSAPLVDGEVRPLSAEVMTRGTRSKCLSTLRLGDSDHDVVVVNLCATSWIC